MHRHGGARPGAGRPRRSQSVPHTARPSFDHRHPLHITLRIARGVWNLRSQRAFRHFAAAIAEEKRRQQLRVIHYSVQGNHVHMIAEAADRASLSKRMQGFTIRLAKALNGMMGRRRGRVFAERYHLHVLRSVRETRNAVRYVLLNHVKHAAQGGRVGITIDPFSSGPWFHRWPTRVVVPQWALSTGPPALADPESWLLRTGCWRGGGLFTS
jgi:REP element-mobilizing transposase RayT